MITDNKTTIWKTIWQTIPAKVSGRTMFVLKRTILLWGFLILSIGNGKWSSSIASAGSLSKNLGQESTLNCSSDEECKINYFCGGKTGHRCVECYDCAKVQRQPKRGYDGKICAHSSVECGSCIRGFDEFGGVCLPRIDRISGQFSKISNFDATRESTYLNANDNILKLSTINWIVAAVLSILILVVIVAIIIRRRYTWCHLTQEEYFSEEKNDNTAELASAPPEEYHQQLSSYLPPAYNYRRNYNRLQQARPFNAGNGAGNWHVTNDEDVDLVDGGMYDEDFVVPQVPPVQLPPVHTYAEDETTNGGTAQNTTPPQAPDEGSTTGIPSVEPASQDFSLGQFSFQAFAWIHARGNTSYGNVANAGAGNQNEHPGQFTISCQSAPVSPRIDDTCFDSVLSLNTSFSPSRSNASIDSGTGGSELGHVPSQLGSGSELQGMSDIEDMSMYDEMFSDPHFFSQASGPGAHQVLQHEIMELD